MNKRSGIVSDEAIVAHIKNKYTYDAEKGTVVNARGHVIKGGVSKNGYLRTYLYIGGFRVEVKLHQMVWVLNHGRLPKMIDHINGDRHENRIENLREVGQSENNINRVWSWRPNPKTGLPGVTLNKDREFVIRVFGKKISFVNKYSAFYHLTLFGRMFSTEDLKMKEENDIVLLEETEEAIRSEVMKLETLEERRKMLHKLRDHVLLMSEVQALPQLVRESYYQTVYAVFKYLRANRQLGREAHRFDWRVLDELLEVISNFLYHDGV